MTDKIAPPPPTTLVVDVDTAANEFDRFADAMDLDLDESVMDADDLTGFKKQKSRIVKAITTGALVVNDDGEAVYTPQNSKSGYHEAITFHERTGASLMAMDGKKKNHDIAKTYAIMGDMTKLHPGTFSKLVGIDVKICEAIFLLLMD